MSPAKQGPCRNLRHDPLSSQAHSAALGGQHGGSRETPTGSTTGRGLLQSDSSSAVGGSYEFEAASHEQQISNSLIKEGGCMECGTAMEAYALSLSVALCACLAVSALCELCADREEQTGVFMPGFA